jgi:hypothetical protein
MNANELADFLDMYFSCNQPASNALCDAATMLRQQQAEIEALKSHPVKELTLSIGEIHAVWAASNYYELDKDGQVDVIKFTEFAYAILKKASEK